MDGLLALLESYDYKERSLVRQELYGGQPPLATELAQRLSSLIDVPIPTDALVREDYHLNWLIAALYIVENPSRQAPYPMSETAGFDFGNQEDIDVLIGFDVGPTTHLVLREMKGEGAWSNKQLDHKVQRLKTIFGDDGLRWLRVQPRFVLGSPSPPKKLHTVDWPAWINQGPNKQPLWLPLSPADPTFAIERRRVHRCDATGVLHLGDWWTTTPLQHFVTDHENGC